MNHEEIKELLGYCAKISSFLIRVKHRISDNLKEVEISEAVENYLNGFNFKDDESARINKLQKKLNKDDGVLVSPEEIQMIINLPGVSINSKPRKDGRYQGYIVDKNGKTYVYGRTMEEVAQKIKRFLQYGTPKKKKPATEKLNGVPATFTAFAMYYFENFRKKKVAERTYYSDIGRFKRYLQPHFKETPLKKITPKDCQDLIDRIEKSGKGKTCDEIYSLLSVILKMAIKHAILLHNPLDVVFHVQHERKHGAALTKEEETTLKLSLKDSPYLPVCMLALYTGLRPNELATAKIDGKFIVAVNSKRKNKKVEYKRIPISKMLAPYVLQTFNVPSLNFLRKLIRETLPGHILYDLRTTFYSRCKECGISEYALNAFVGHSLGALGNAYTDLSDEYLLKEMDKFEY